MLRRRVGAPHGFAHFGVHSRTHARPRPTLIRLIQRATPSRVVFSGHLCDRSATGTFLMWRVKWTGAPRLVHTQESGVTLEWGSSPPPSALTVDGMAGRVNRSNRGIIPAGCEPVVGSSPTFRLDPPSRRVLSFSEAISELNTRAGVRACPRLDPNGAEQSSERRVQAGSRSMPQKRRPLVGSISSTITRKPCFL